MKTWENPELRDLGLQETSESEACPNEMEALNEAATLTLFPQFVWGDGKIGCTYWDVSLKGCANPNYGQKGKCWPCPPVIIKGSQG